MIKIYTQNLESGGIGLHHSSCLLDDVVDYDIDLCDGGGACCQDLLLHSHIPDQDVAVVDGFDPVDDVTANIHTNQLHESPVWWPSAVLEGKSLNPLPNVEVKFAPDVSDELLIIVEPSDATVGRGRKVSAGVRRAALFDNFLGGLTPEMLLYWSKSMVQGSLVSNMDDFHMQRKLYGAILTKVTTVSRDRRPQGPVDRHTSARTDRARDLKQAGGTKVQRNAFIARGVSIHQLPAGCENGWRYFKIASPSRLVKLSVACCNK